MDGLNFILAKAKEANKANPGDYIGPHGLLECGKCHTPKQYRLTGNVPVGYDVVPVPCRCMEEKAEAEAKEQENKEKFLKLRTFSTMDNRYFDATFEVADFKQAPKPMKTCKRYAEIFNDMAARNQGLLLYGDTGTGKTYASACIANALMANGISVLMTSFVKVLQQSGENEAVMEDHIKRVGLVVFDDLGAERTSDYGLEKVYGIIDARYRSGKPMVITTNLTLDMMMNASDIRYARIFDRLFEVCYPVVFDNKSWRKKEAGKRYTEVSKLLEE